MPTIFSPLITPNLISNMPAIGRGTHALTKLQFTLDGPPDMRNYARVVNGAAKSLRHFLIAEEIHDDTIWKELTDLEHLDAELQARPSRPQFPRTTGYGGKYLPWGYIDELPTDPEDEVQMAIGAELVVSHILRRQFRTKVIKDLKIALDDANPSHECKKILSRLRLEAARLLESFKTQSNSGLQTYVRIQATLSSQLHPMRLVERQDAGTTEQLSDAEALLAAKLLKEAAQNGCIESLQIIIAFCIGIVWDVALDVPFAHVIGDEWIAQLDITTGITRIDLKPVLPHQAKAQNGHIPSVPVVVRPLPIFAHELLVALASKCPDIKCIRELNQTSLKSHHSIPGLVGARAERITIARFIASRGRIAKIAGIDAATVAYATCDLTKIGKAKHSYITFTANEILDAVQKIFEYLDWGKPTPLETSNGIGVGSSATPSREITKAIDNYLLEQYEGVKAGKKYTLNSLTKHNNAYAKFCANRVAFLESGRLADELSLLASDYRIGAAFGGCARFCVNGKSIAGCGLYVRKHNDNQKARSTSRTTGQPAGRLQEA